MTTKDVKYWLEDKELRTPEHDKMVLFTFENVAKILKELNFTIEKIYKKEIESGSPFSGYIDLKIECSLNRSVTNFFFEIKPKIKSIGEVMRQINFYRLNRDKYNSTFILVTKTKGLKEIFKSQDVYVYEYEEEGEEKCQKKL